MIKGIPDKVLVSVREVNSGKSIDMELPSQMPAKDLAIGISRFLNKMHCVSYISDSAQELWFCDRRIRDTDTLASLGIWDGNEIEIKQRVR